MNILGISAFYHDSAACLVRDGRIIAAAQEERFTRKKHDASFPKFAADYCLRESGIDFGGVYGATGNTTAPNASYPLLNDPSGQIYSFHTGVANILLADGSVRSIRDSIDVGTRTPPRRV